MAKADKTVVGLQSRIVVQIIENPKRWNSMLVDFFNNMYKMDGNSRSALLKELTDEALKLPEKDFEGFELALFSSLTDQPDAIKRTIMESDLFLVSNLSGEDAAKAKTALRNIIKMGIEHPVPEVQKKGSMSGTEMFVFMKPELAIDLIKNLLDITFDLPEPLYYQFIRMSLENVADMPEDTAITILRRWFTAVGFLSPLKAELERETRQKALKSMPRDKRQKIEGYLDMIRSTVWI